MPLFASDVMAHHFFLDNKLFMILLKALSGDREARLPATVLGNEPVFKDTRSRVSSGN